MQVIMNLDVDKVAVANKPLTQWDYGQKLQLNGVDLPTIYEVHFSTYKTKGALVVDATGNIVDIPDEILASACADKINVYVYVKTETDGTTVYKGIINCNMRSKPDDYPVEIFEKVTKWEEVLNNYAPVIMEKIEFSGNPLINNTVLENTLERVAYLDITTNNLFAPTATSKTVSGIAYTVKKDGFVSATGTATANAWLELGKVKLEVGKRYKLCGNPSTDCPIALYKKDDSTLSILNRELNGVEFVAEEDEANVWIRVDKNITVSNKVFKPMITEDMKATYYRYIPKNGFDLTVVNNADSTESRIYTVKTGMNKILLFEGGVNFKCSPNPDASLKYAVDTKAYIDSKLANLS